MTERGRDRFSTTRWSLVLAAAGGSPTDAREAWSILCNAYWYPLYVFLRRRGHTAQDAEDLTQGFFALFLERGAIHTADPQRGRFRSFLLTSLQHYVINEHHRASALKRGGRSVQNGLEFEAAERRYSLEPRDEETPERAFDRRWALTLLDRVFARCKEEYERAGKDRLFASLSPLLTQGTTDRPYAEIARDLGTTEGALKVAAHRLKDSYRRLLRDEVAETVSSPADVDAEIRHLLAAVGSFR
jgi:RNA polymerase sigma factor (sigma-70 family)